MCTYVSGASTAARGASLESDSHAIPSASRHSASTDSRTDYSPGELTLYVSLGTRLLKVPNMIVACVVVQAVVKANSQSNVKWQISTLCGSKTPEQLSMKIRIYNCVMGMTTHVELLQRGWSQLICDVSHVTSFL